VSRIAALLDAAHQQLGGPIVPVWDGLPGHRSAAMRHLPGRGREPRRCRLGLGQPDHGRRAEHGRAVGQQRPDLSDRSGHRGPVDSDHHRQGLVRQADT
jgi:hypothetical protein